MHIDELKHNIISVSQRVRRAAERAGHNVTIVAATKTVSAEDINNAVALGIAEVGENRVQEYLSKRDAVSGAKWHFIGTLQRNKAKYLVGSVALIQSVSSLDLAQEISRIAAARGIVQDVLIEVNAANEPSKTGVPFEQCHMLVCEAGAMSGVRVRGLMAVPPKGATPDVYDRLYELYSKYRSDTFNTLSVGMSADFELAIEHGSNMVRPGSAIFGPRSYMVAD